MLMTCHDESIITCLQVLANTNKWEYKTVFGYEKVFTLVICLYWILMHIICRLSNIKNQIIYRVLFFPKFWYSGLNSISLRQKYWLSDILPVFQSFLDFRIVASNGIHDSRFDKSREYCNLQAMSSLLESDCQH